MSYIQTISGKKFDLACCTPNDINIADIAHALSHVNRFGGHSKRAYCVAEHSAHACSLARERGLDPLSMLLHDAAEAYIGDIPRHIKQYLEKAYELENQVATAIAARFGSIWPMTPEMKQLDNDLLETEFQQVMNGSFEGREIYGTPIPIHVQYWAPDTARRIFLNMFERLYDKD